MDAHRDDCIAVLLDESLDGGVGVGAVDTFLPGEVFDEYGTLGVDTLDGNIALVLGDIIARRCGYSHSCEE